MVTRIGRWASVGLAAVCFGLLVGWVDWTPEVDPNYFFSSHDPQLRTQKEISKLFPESNQMVFQARGDLRAAAYQEKVGQLTKEIAALPGVVSVYSIAHGPGGLKDALKSPFWRRILISDDERASNLFVFVESPLPEGLIVESEKLRARHESADFQLILSGASYVSELIRRSLLRDLRIFSLAAFLIFGTAVWLLFHSTRMVVGTVVACINATGITLVISQLLGVRIGLLTANLVTILFVLTLSPILFLTSNWRYLVEHRGKGPAPTHRDAIRKTLEPSFWSMLTTLLGFGSLLFTQAVPLKWFGLSGAIGTLVTFLTVYGNYVWFLPPEEKVQSAPARVQSIQRAARSFFSLSRGRFVAGLVGACLLVGTGLWRLNTDPSLLSYFSPRSELGKGLRAVDESLGSSPLEVVVRDVQGKKLNTTEAYRELWTLHEALERDPEVGSAISLPLIMAEARRSLVGSILPWEWLFELMEMSGFRQIARLFVTEDRTSGFFLLMMRESVRREGSRLETVSRIQGIVSAHGFEPELVGGVYALQGRMARLVTSSLLSGLVMLIILFSGIAWALSRSWKIASAVGASLCLIPLWMLGLLGFLELPFDIISSPAANIAVGMGVDAMLYTLVWVRHHAGERRVNWDDWVEARVWLWRPVLCSAAIVGVGFGIFGFSTFPPTQRFGLSIVLGTLMAPLCALLVLPKIASIGHRNRGISS